MRLCIYLTFLYCTPQAMCTPRRVTDYGGKTAPNMRLLVSVKVLTSTETLGSIGPNVVRIVSLAAQPMAALNPSLNLRLEPSETSC